MTSSSSSSSSNTTTKQCLFFGRRRQRQQQQQHYHHHRQTEPALLLVLVLVLLLLLLLLSTTTTSARYFWCLRWHCGPTLQRVLFWHSTTASLHPSALHCTPPHSAAHSNAPVLGRPQQDRPALLGEAQAQTPVIAVSCRPSQARERCTHTADAPSAQSYGRPARAMFSRRADRRAASSLSEPERPSQACRPPFLFCTILPSLCLKGRPSACPSPSLRQSVAPSLKP